uniref:Uncharacterized protein n=1 Tax=Octopus bimaculoides TaxID=37653 RepID=A0A0L8FTH7_OCTBM
MASSTLSPARMSSQDTYAIHHTSSILLDPNILISHFICNCFCSLLYIGVNSNPNLKLTLYLI